MKALRVLVVEDQAIIAMLLAEVLAGMGHDICSVESSEAGAVAAAVRYKPDLMVVDVWLRDGSGISAVEEIQRAGFIPHVFVSGDPSEVLTLRPGSIVMQKPFSETELVHAIQRALDTAGKLDVTIGLR